MMRIYICTPKNFYNREKLQSQFYYALKKYYGKFLQSDIEFFESPDENFKVYIMEKPLKKNSEDEIIKTVKEIINKPVDIKLNYGLVNPDFKPEKFAPVPKPEAKKSEKKSEDNENKSAEFDYEKLSENYHAEQPHYTFEQVILPKETRDKILEAVATIQVEEKVFDEWGLRTIIPFATSAMSFYGPPRTGKTMAAEAVASMLDKKIIRAAYADIESKYHGEDPKMVKAIFKAAERDDAVLFLDESDSLLSKRLTNVTEGSAQAINSMRSPAFNFT